MNTVPCPPADQTSCDKRNFFEQLVNYPAATHVIVIVNNKPYEYAVRDFIRNFLPRYDDCLIHVRNDSIRVNDWTLVETDRP